jgi:hypothetical protein
MELAPQNKINLKKAVNNLYKIAISTNSKELAGIYGTIIADIEILSDFDIKFDDIEEITND